MSTFGAWLRHAGERNRGGLSAPIGALIGGLRGDQIGLRPATFVGAIGGLLAVYWVRFTPVRQFWKQAAQAPS